MACQRRTSGSLKIGEEVRVIRRNCCLGVVMEVDEEKLIEGVVVWTADDFLKYAKDCKICLFT